MPLSRIKFNITLRFIAYLTILSFLPILAIGMTAIEVSRSILAAEASRHAAQQVSAQQDYLHVQMDQVESLIANISSVDAIAEALSQTGQPRDSFTNLATQARIGYILNSYLNIKGLVSIEIFTPEGTHYHVGDTLDVAHVRHDVRQRIYAGALTSPNVVHWAGVEDNVNGNSSYRKVIAAAKIIRGFDRRTLAEVPIALLIVNYSVDMLYQHFRDSETESASHMLVADATGRIIYHPDHQLIGERLSTSFAEGFQEKSGSFTHPLDGKPVVVTYLRSDRSNWLVAEVVELRIAEPACQHHFEGDGRGDGDLPYHRPACRHVLVQRYRCADQTHHLPVPESSGRHRSARRPAARHGQRRSCRPDALVQRLHGGT